MNFEEALNAHLKTGNLRVHVAIVPLPRDLLMPALTEGKVDLVAAQLTVTPERQKLVDFTNPTRTNVNEIVVTGPGGPAIIGLRTICPARRSSSAPSSSYHESLVALNEQLQGGRASRRLVIKPAPENLEDDDILEMVNAGLVRPQSSTTTWRSSGSRCSRRSRASPGCGAAHRRRPRGGHAEEQPEDEERGQHSGCRSTASVHVLRQRPAEALPGEHPVREERGGRAGTAQVQRDARCSSASTASSTRLTRC